MNPEKYHDDLSHIRSMMERGSRFISLSGISGVGAGIVALIGSFYIHSVLRRAGVDYSLANETSFTPNLVAEFIVTGLAVLLLAVFSAYFFTSRKSRKTDYPVWNTITRRMLSDFAVPLITGALVVTAFFTQHLYLLIAPASLVFYGLALISAEKHTLTDIKYLGYCSIILGVISTFVPAWGLICWGLGFGVLHIVYGTAMYIKYK